MDFHEIDMFSVISRNQFHSVYIDIVKRYIKIIIKYFNSELTNYRVLKASS